MILRKGAIPQGMSSKYAFLARCGDLPCNPTFSGSKDRVKSLRHPISTNKKLG
jgi:hypothetical protein